MEIKMKLDRKLCMGFMRALLTISIGISLPGCSLTGEAFSGYVLEQGTESPIEGAIVVAGWKGHVATWAHGRTVCYHVETAVTDSNGRFHFPAWRKDISEKWQKNVRFERVSVDIYFPAYELSSRLSEGVYSLEPFVGGQKKRIEYLKEFEISLRRCRSRSAGESSLIPVYRALYNEVKGLDKVDEAESAANAFLAGIDVIELGYDEGLRRAVERTGRNGEGR